MKKIIPIICLLLISFIDLRAQDQSIAPPAIDTRIYQLIDSVSSDRIRMDITKLVSFGTRNTFSDTVSEERGIGAARRWIKSEFEQISQDCNNCLEIFYQKQLVTKEANSRVPKDAWIVNVVAIQKGTEYPDNYIIMSGDIDSRASNTMDFETDAPGANDNASGMAGTIEAARVLSKYKFKHSLVYVGLSGEEQGLFGGAGLAEYAKNNKWNILGVLNNDMIGNIEGVDGVIDNRSFRIFSEPVPPTETERQRTLRRYYGGEVDGISRQLARYVHKQTETYMPEMKPMMIYRLDRFGRGGHHKPFNDLGFAGVRIMESHENYNRQHQDIRVEDGIAYGDVLSGVDFNYAKKLTAVNVITMAKLGWAPEPPKNVGIGGVVEPSAKLKWDRVNDENIVGYKIYWRLTTSPTWDNYRYVGDLNFYTLEGIVIDNYYFGVASVAANGSESLVVFPQYVIR